MPSPRAPAPARTGFRRGIRGSCRDALSRRRINGLRHVQTAGRRAGPGRNWPSSQERTRRRTRRTSLGEGRRSAKAALRFRLSDVLEKAKLWRRASGGRGRGREGGTEPGGLLGQRKDYATAAVGAGDFPFVRFPISQRARRQGDPDVSRGFRGTTCQFVSCNEHATRGPGACSRGRRAAQLRGRVPGKPPPPRGAAVSSNCSETSSLRNNI